MKKILWLSLFFTKLSLAAVAFESEIGIYSDFIWRGTTFSENKPAVQGILDAEEAHGLFLGTFVSNAEFSDEALGENTHVTSEIDFIVGKRWFKENWEIQLSYNKFIFPNAEIFNSDEFNILGRYKSIAYEISYMDDYFGYQGVYQYYRLGYIHELSPSLETTIFVGYNAFKNPKGSLKSRCLDNACAATAQTTSGAGNPDYIDIYQVTRKTISNGTSFELAFNWTNRKEYTAADNVISKTKAKDFAVIIALVMPIPL